MAHVPGYLNTISTQYGMATFWVVTGLHYDAGVGTTITMSGYPTPTDADTPGILPTGTYSFSLSPLQTLTLFAGGQSLMGAAILGSSPLWAGATFVPPGS
jgi:hypothetical protein